MLALTAEELMVWVESMTEGWRRLATSRPELLDLPADIAGTHTVGELLQHIVAVELRYAQRLAGVAVSPYEDVPTGPPEAVFAVHHQAMEELRRVIADAGTAWEEPLTFATRSAGPMCATRRTVLVHALMHSVRHYAQLGTLARQHGLVPDRPMDYLFTRLSSETGETPKH